jgi:hypothetical protein
MDVLADMVVSSLLDPEEVDRERTVVQQEIKRSYDQPSAWAGELLSRASYGDQPVGWPIAGRRTVGEFSDSTSRPRGTWYAPTTWSSASPATPSTGR